MIRQPKKDVGLGSSIACSLLLHAALLAGLTLFTSFLQVNPTVAPVYYVDILNLPTANPRAGSPGASGKDSAPPAPAPTPAQEREEMRLPPKKLSAPTTKQAPEKKPTAETEKEFRERLARLENKVEGQHATAAIEALRRKAAAGSGRAGMPTGTGTEAGSDYGSYIQSRLKDAFALTIASSSRNPMVVARLTIDRHGKVIGLRIERSSGDKVFEESVERAVDRASANFPPPPGSKEFQQGFIFKPEGVGIK
jgi:colicin import membrane protein